MVACVLPVTRAAEERTPERVLRHGVDITEFHVVAKLFRGHGLPLNAERLCSGAKVPTNGGAPASTGAAAWLSNVAKLPEQSVAPAP